MVMPKDKYKNGKMYSVMLHKHESVLLSLLRDQNIQKVYFIPWVKLFKKTGTFYNYTWKFTIIHRFSLTLSLISIEVKIKHQ